MSDPSFSPAAGVFWDNQTRSISISAAGSTSIRYTTDGSNPDCSTGQIYSSPVDVTKGITTLKAIACDGATSSAVVSGTYDINRWRSVDVNGDGSVTADGTTTVNSSSSVTLAGQGQIRSSGQTFRYVYTKVEGNFTFTARLDSATFGAQQNTGRAGLMLVPTFADVTGNNFTYGGAFYRPINSPSTSFEYVRAHRLVGTTNTNSSTASLSSTGIVSGGDAYLRIRRDTDGYRASYSLNGGTNWGNETSLFNFTAGLPTEVYVGIAFSSGSDTVVGSTTFSDVLIVDSSASTLVGPNEF